MLVNWYVNIISVAGNCFFYCKVQSIKRNVATVVFYGKVLATTVAFFNCKFHRYIAS